MIRVLSIIALILYGCNNSSPPLFEVIRGKDAGIEFINKIDEREGYDMIDYYYVYNGGGVGSGDFNNDGLIDLYFSGNLTSSKLYLNKGNLTFEDVTDISGTQTTGWASGVTVVDINNDGWSDIYVSRAGTHEEKLRKNLLFINKGLSDKGIPKFEEKALDYGIADSRHTTQSVFFDFDKDGDLDLFLLNHTTAYRRPNNITGIVSDGTGAANDALYRNDGSDSLTTGGIKFTEITIEAGILFDGMGLGVAINDFNMDGWDDIYVSNDFISHDFLYINKGDGTFEESGEKYFKHFSHFGMGNDAADINNDGLIDLVVADMLPNEHKRRSKMAGPMAFKQYMMTLQAGYQPQFMRNTLQLNNGSGHGIKFSEIGQLAGISSTDWSWSPLLADFDQDGLRDLFISNGYKRFVTDMDFVAYGIVNGSKPIKNTTESTARAGSKLLPGIGIHNFIFKNNGDLTFKDVSNDWGFEDAGYSHGAVYSDLDNDGDLDIVVSNVDDFPTIYKNNSEALLNHNYYTMVLEGSQNLGSKIWIYTDTITQYSYTQNVRGYQSSVDPRIFFGLGNYDIIDSLKIQWPDGRWQVMYDIKANKQDTITYSPNAFNSGVKPVLSSTLLEEVGKELNLSYQHRESSFGDFDHIPLLTKRLSDEGPAMTVGDINQDGLEDLFVGSSQGQLSFFFLQGENGNFSQGIPLQGSEKFEEVDAVFIDYDGDQDKDLYIVRGSSEYFQSEYLEDILLINDGRGNFSSGVDKIPSLPMIGSCVRVGDYDNDGLNDLFVGGRVLNQQYPMPASSRLFRNTGTGFTDVTKRVAPDLLEIGMVTDMLWTDINSDGLPDMILVGDFMPVTVLLNDGNGFHPSFGDQLKDTHGWWYTIAEGDFDNDGDFDYILGNHGLNSKYVAEVDQPIQLYAKDFDRNGQIDPIITHYLNGKERLVNSRDQFLNQLPATRRIFTTYEAFAQVSVEDLFSKSDYKDMLVLKAQVMGSCIMENKGGKGFNIRFLPNEVQLAPLQDVLVDDLNHDGNLDILVIGNDFGFEVVSGQHDAFFGKVLLGDGNGNFNTIQESESGFIIEGDGRRIKKILVDNQVIYLTVENNGYLKAFRSH